MYNPVGPPIVFFQITAASGSLIHSDIRGTLFCSRQHSHQVLRLQQRESEQRLLRQRRHGDVLLQHRLLQRRRRTPSRLPNSGRLDHRRGGGQDVLIADVQIMVFFIKYQYGNKLKLRQGEIVYLCKCDHFPRTLVLKIEPTSTRMHAPSLSVRVRRCKADAAPWPCARLLCL